MAAVTGGKLWEPLDHSIQPTVLPDKIPWFSFRSLVGLMLYGVITVGVVFAISSALSDSLGSGIAASYEGGPLTPADFEMSDTLLVQCLVLIILLVIPVSIFFGFGIGSVEDERVVGLWQKLSRVLVVAFGIGACTIISLHHFASPPESLADKWVQDQYGYQSTAFGGESSGETTVVTADGTEKTVKITLNDNNEYVLYNDSEDLTRQLNEQKKDKE